MPDSVITFTRACPLCGADNIPYRLQTVIIRNNTAQVGLNKCMRCGLQYISPCLSQHILSQMYSYDYATDTISGVNHLNADTCASDYDAFYRFVVHFLPHGGHILDIGCGVGTMLDAFTEDIRFTISGVEISGYAAEIGRRKGHNIFVGDLEDLDLPDNSCDAILLLYVLEHVLHPGELLAHTRRILKPGGHLFIAVPNYRYLRIVADNRYARLFQGYKADLLHCKEHLQNFTPKTLKNLLERQGYSVIKFGCAKPLHKGSFFSQMVKLIAYAGVYLGFILGYHCGGIQCIAHKPKGQA
jgi:ubiquinone/menaquinone biosynthesis C-methylase UbiE